MKSHDFVFPSPHRDFTSNNAENHFVCSDAVTECAQFEEDVLDVIGRLQLRHQLQFLRFSTRVICAKS